MTAKSSNPERQIWANPELSTNQRTLSATSESFSSQLTSGRSAIVNSDLWDLGLDDTDFHKLTLRFAALLLNNQHFPAVKMPKYAVIIGVAEGDEMQKLMKAGLHTLAVEPLDHYVQLFEKTYPEIPVSTQLDTDDLFPSGVRGRLLKRAVSDVDDEKLNLSYALHGVGGLKRSYSLATTISLGRLADYQAPSLISLDCNGCEPGAWKGAKPLLRGPHRTPMIWMEVSGCHEHESEIAQWMAEEYDVFDFQWFGALLNGTREAVAKRDSLSVQRVGANKESPYFEAMCSARKDQRFAWLQTDFIYVRNDLVTPELVRALRDVATFPKHAL
eukprot:CAMPEP_0198332058 /NCGR_PEP_ID=MMETSP1450-20131203/18024_1 /TAXON_ID=753684 ORGANISM="Madagascaria erythrocladiodes, Strain CCMP3234" /NCGR_SAMPLE_ID=MMETSP1450 /ASSEMBLY_ACC=CAM_ASM_001115 /LENGTH=329 /DNA_ID=CAMNT_0044036489 /DNA_START=613 /DNA_END=1602 /DNA_ORIENTATION=-